MTSRSNSEARRRVEAAVQACVETLVDEIRPGREFHDVAMAARQNVAAAADGGLLALTAGVAAVVVSFALVPVLSRIGSSGGNGSGDNRTASADGSRSETDVT